MEGSVESLFVESLRLIVQAQLVLDDLQRNQKKLEGLIRTLIDAKDKP